jgi:hypothetical protein
VKPIVLHLQNGRTVFFVCFACQDPKYLTLLSFAKLPHLQQTKKKLPSPSFGPHSPTVTLVSRASRVSRAAWPWTFAQIFQLRKPSPTDVTQPIRLWPRPDLSRTLGWVVGRPPHYTTYYTWGLLGQRQEPIGDH